MRRGFVWYSLVLLLATGVCVRANLLENPGFEEGDTGQISNVPIPGWLTWNFSGWHHDDVGAVIDTKAVKLWWSDSGIYQDFPAIPGHTYRFSGYMLHTSGDPLRDGPEGPGTGDKTGDLQYEWYDAANILITDGFFGQITKNDVTDTWLFYTGDVTAPPGTAYGRYLVRMYASMGDGAVNYDNASVYDAALYGQAYDPNPADGEIVSLDLDDLSWKNHDPNDTFTFDVYLEAEGPVVDPNFYSAPITTGLTDNTVNLTAAGVTLMDSTIYTWRVDTTDPNNGWPVVFPGNVWIFQVGDVAPTVNAGDDQYNWIYMEDGDGDPAKVTFTVTGTYTDDGKSDITRAEWVQGTHEGGGMVTIESQTWTPGTGTHTSGMVEAVVSATGNGWLFLTLEVEDTIGISSDTMNVGVYNTCLEAAIEDPADTTIEDNWPNGQHGDINGDCKTNLEDVAILALTWVDCMTEKADCTP